MQIADLRALFQLPIPELEPNVGCNLTATGAMLNLISGFSVWFFQTEEAAEIRKLEAGGASRESRRRFIGFVKEYWPQVGPEPSSDGVAARLYEVRNSLSHDLGVHDDPKQSEPRHIRLAKRPIPPEEIAELELLLSHPFKVPVIERRGEEYIVHLSGVYWALHRMLRSALADRPDEIEATIAAVSLPEITESIE